ncbi:nuclear transport factor 2 family protein [Streptomyces cyaneofuscatus]|uniref:nuclear transport factor 2 family protein n=1 Tax=Streptomyces cyaneofuscatus TaxID=66883 RepID=UPI0037989237
MTAHTAPEDLYRQGLRMLLDKDVPGRVGLWDEAGVFEFPFAPDGWPRRLEGRGAVAAYMRDPSDLIGLHDLPYVEIHRADAPGTIGVEMRGVGRVVETGGPFGMACIAVVTFEGGLIVRYRDYGNPLVAQGLSGGGR